MNNRILFTELGKLLWKIIRCLILIGLSYVLLYPILYLIVTSLKDADQIMDPSIVWLPKKIIFSNFSYAWTEMKYLKSFGTSVMVALISSVLQLISCSLAGYSFARYKFKGSSVLFLFVLVTLIMPSDLITIPLRFLYQEFSIPIISPILDLLYRQTMPDFLTVNLMDSWFVFWLQALFATGIRAGLFIFIFRQFFQSTPLEIEEAAMVDGAGHFKTFYSVMVPNASGAFLTVFLFSIVWYWNDTFYTNHFISNKKTLAKALTQMQSELSKNSADFYGSSAKLMASTLLFIIPMLIMYAVLQKYFVESVDRSGLVG